MSQWLDDYEEGLASDERDMRFSTPLWMKRLGYTSRLTGLRAIIKLKDIFEKIEVKGIPPMMMTASTLDLTPDKKNSESIFCQTLTQQQYYVLFEDGRVKLKILSGTLMQKEDKTWMYFITCEMLSRNKHIPISRYVSGYVTVSHISIGSQSFPMSFPEETILCEVTGDPELILTISSSPTFRLKSAKSTLESLTGGHKHPPHLPSNPSFFNSISSRLIGHEQNTSQHPIYTSASDLERKRSLSQYIGKSFKHRQRTQSEIDIQENIDIELMKEYDIL